MSGPPTSIGDRPPRRARGRDGARPGGVRPLAGTLAAEAHTANRDVPIFMAHGTDDPLITLARAQRSRDLLRESGYRVEWHEYPMAHQVCDEELRDLSAWLRRVLDGGPVSV